MLAVVPGDARRVLDALGVDLTPPCRPGRAGLRALGPRSDTRRPSDGRPARASPGAVLASSRAKSRAALAVHPRVWPWTPRWSRSEKLGRRRRRSKTSWGLISLAIWGRFRPPGDVRRISTAISRVAVACLGAPVDAQLERGEARGVADLRGGELVRRDLALDAQAGRSSSGWSAGEEAGERPGRGRRPRRRGRRPRPGSGR